MPRRPDYKEVTEQSWKQVMSEIVNRSLTLLDSSQKLIDNGGHEALCAGLYTYAVEEYGKLLILKKYLPISGKVTIKYREEYCDHVKKFNDAVASLPIECINLLEGAFDPEFFDPAYFDTEDVVADFEARMAIFYADFNDTGDGVTVVPPIDRDKLKNAIGILRAILAATVTP